MRKNFLQRQYYLSQWYYSKRLTGVLLVSFLNMQLNFIIRDFVLQLPIFFSAQFFTALVSFKFARMDFSGTMLSTLAHKPGAGGGFCERGVLEI